MERETAANDLWARVETILLGASERVEHCGPETLDAWLDDACGGDPELRRQVDRLLEHDGEVANRFDAALAAEVAGAAAGVLATLDSDATAVAPGQPTDAVPMPATVGGYRLLARLGEGGAGTVFRAEPLARPGEAVAIKILRHGPWSPAAARRFAAEREFLGRLDHPNIARSIDGGTTPNGSPYLVMELVEGEPIDAYCARHELSIEERLRLFLPVCSAVHDAHRHLIVHRDLKPSNVLVTHDGVPKLLDFGIAKWLEPGAESMTGSQVPMTPRYASPEQLAGERVTTVSDVYSLGLLLHELLTGQRLFGDVETPAAVLERRARDGRPAPPSTVAPPALRRQLRGDLDRILGMALADEPERRYASAAQLAEDLERHLDRRPVRARPDTVSYRMTRFVRRHRLVVAVGAAVLVGLLVAIVQAMRIAQQRDRAVRAVTSLTEVIGLADAHAGPGDTVSQRALLDRAAEQIEALPEESTPEMAELYSTLAGLYLRLGLGAPARRHYERALTIARRGGDDVRVAETVNALAIAMVQVGELEGAEPYFEEALSIRRRLYGAEHEKVSASLNNLALIQHDLGRYPRARALYRRAVELDRRLLGADHVSTATTLSNLALLDYDEGRYTAAAEEFREVLAVLRARVGPGDLELAEPMQMLALALAEIGDVDAARDFAERSLAVRRRVLGEEHRDVARGLDTWGRVLWIDGDIAAAEAPLRDALRLRLDLLGDEHAETAASYLHVGELDASLGRVDAAMESLYRAIDAYDASLPAGHPLRAAAAVDLAMVAIDAGRCEQAITLLAEAVARFASGSWRVAEAEAAAALCRGDLEESERRRVDLAAGLGGDHRRVRRLERLVDQGKGGVSSPGVNGPAKPGMPHSSKGSPSTSMPSTSPDS